MVTIETISIVFTGLSISLAAFYYINTLRNAQENQRLQLETRQAQLYMQFYSKWCDKEFARQWQEFQGYMWSDFEDYMNKYSPDKNIEASSSMLSIGRYFEGLGVLVGRKLVDVDLVDDLMSGTIIRYWEKFEPIMVEYREQMGWPQLGEWVEFLYNQIKPLAEKQLQEIETINDST